MNVRESNVVEVRMEVERDGLASMLAANVVKDLLRLQRIAVLFVESE